jgi:hypothetical protein
LPLLDNLEDALVSMWFVNGESINTDGDGGGNSDEGDARALAASYRASDGVLYKEISDAEAVTGQEQEEEANQINYLVESINAMELY